MAKIVGGSPLGTLSGKMGGMVFAHNKSGPYVRQYVVPVDPRSGAQERARASFGTAVGSFHSLTPAEKTIWQQFAVSTFNPRNGINIGQFSSINAYTALRTAVNQATKLADSPEMFVNGVSLPVQPTYEMPTFSNQPPTFTVQPNFKEAVTGNAITVNNITARVEEGGAFEVTLNINPGLTGAPDLEGLVDAVDHKLGFGIFMSSANVQGGLFYENPERYLLSYIQHNDAGVSDLTAVQTIKFKSAGMINVADYQSWPKVGMYFQLKVYVMDGKSGTWACLGTAQPPGLGAHEIIVEANGSI